MLLIGRSKAHIAAIPMSIVSYFGLCVCGSPAIITVGLTRLHPRPTARGEFIVVCAFRTHAPSLVTTYYIPLKRIMTHEGGIDGTFRVHTRILATDLANLVDALHIAMLRMQKCFRVSAKNCQIVDLSGGSPYARAIKMDHTLVI